MKKFSSREPHTIIDRHLIEKKLLQARADFRYKSIVSMIAELPESAEGQSPMSDLMTMTAKRHLGEVAAIIISALISHGRLTAKELGKRSGVPIKLVKTTLVSLIQLNCVLYWQEGEKVEYKFNETGLMVFLHSGEIINFIKDNFDIESAELIQNLIQVGNVNLNDILKTYQDETKKYQMHQKLNRLFSDGWIKVLQKSDFSPIEDLWNKVYQDTLKVTPRSTSISEIKRVSEVKERSKLKLAEILNSTPKDLYENVDGAKLLNRRLQISFSYSRFTKHLRSKSLVTLCESRIGLITSLVYSTILKLVETKSPEINHYMRNIDGMLIEPEEVKRFEESLEDKLVESKSITFKTHDVARHLNKNLDLRNSILTHNFLKPNDKKRVVSFSELEKVIKKPKLENGEAILEDSIDIDNDYQEVGSLNNTDNTQSQSISLINHHLKLLSSSTAIPFITELTPGIYTIPYNKLKEIVLEYTYQEIIKKTLGNDTLRILRCVKESKLVDEKTVATSVLLKDKLVRNEIYKLVQYNLIEVQEIPRSNDRAASKTFFAFRYKKFNSYNFLKNTLLYNMANILHTIESFKVENKVLLDKCEREDVKGHESELLLESELRVLNNLKYREINNIGKLHRLLALYDIFC